MASYKEEQNDYQSFDHDLNSISLDLSFIPHTKTHVLSDSVPFYLDIEKCYEFAREKCVNFVRCIQSSIYDSASESINHLGYFFRNNRILLRRNNVEVIEFINIFEATHIIPIISSSLKNLFYYQQFKLINSIVFFISKFSSCNNLFCNYLSNVFLFDFISSFEIILSSETIQDNNRHVFIILYNLFPYINLDSFKMDKIIPVICSYAEFLFNYKLELPHIIIELLYRIINKVDAHVVLYRFFIQFLLKDGCLNGDSFSIAVSTLYIMLKISKNSSDDLIIYILNCKILNNLYEIYVENKGTLSPIFPLYMKIITKVVKIFVDESKFDASLLNRREEILSLFSYRVLFSKLKGFDNDHTQSVIGFINVLLQQKKICQVFKSSRELLQSILSVYRICDQKSRAKILKCFLYMLNYSNFFRKELFAIDFSVSFADFIDCQNEKSIYNILEIILYALRFYEIEHQQFELLKSLRASDDFMSTLYLGSQESTNEDLRSKMLFIWSKLNELE